MAAFDRVLSGIPQMDERFDNIRLGDNVVWRVDKLADFRLFVEPYVEQAIRDRCNKKMLLMVPGRIGTTSPELGVPTAFADISEFDAICEVSNSKAGYNPKLSYGSHFFQDLVESGILYNAIFENEKTVAFHPERITGHDIFRELVKDGDGLEEIVHVYDVSDQRVCLCNDMKTEHILCFRQGE